MQPPLLQQVFWGTPAPGLEPGQAAAQVRAVHRRQSRQLAAQHCRPQACMPRLWPKQASTCVAPCLLQTPGDMFAAACLLGDLFPPEWPAVGRKVTQVGPGGDTELRTLPFAKLKCISTCCAAQQVCPVPF